MNEKASRIISAIEHAIRHVKTAQSTFEAAPLEPNAPWPDNLPDHCSAMFRETMRQLEMRSHQNWHIGKTYADENKDANRIGNLIRGDRYGWKPVDIHKAQLLANGGKLLVASLVREVGHGHLAFVYPAEHLAENPMLRDGNRHPNVNSGKPGYSTYGAVPMTRVFGPDDLKSVKWFQFLRY
jgi:hypothetical protein